MHDPAGIAGSPEILAAWLASLAAALWLTEAGRRRAWRRLAESRARPGAGWRGLHRDEHGAAYSLVYVMVVPLYAVFVCTAIETTWMMIAKAGTSRAAFAAARCAIVRADGGALDRDAAREAAVVAFAPFATGMSPGGGGGSAGSAREDAYVRCYRSLAGPAPSAGYARAKFRYAAAAVSVELERIPQPDREAPWRDEMAATVAYEFPFRIAAVGRFMGRRGPGGRYTYRIASRAVLPVETPANPEESLGIEWRTDP